MKTTTRTTRSAYSTRDILVLLACAAFLLLNLAAIGSTGRRRAKEVVCRSNLRQWGDIFQRFINENDGSFYSPPLNYRGWLRGAWRKPLRRYLPEISPVFRCPEAVKDLPDDYWGGPFNAYGSLGPSMGGPPPDPRLDLMSYGTNCWTYKPHPADYELQNRPAKWHWGRPQIKGGENIPVFADTMYPGGGPTSGDPYEQVNGMSRERSNPPAFDGEWTDSRAEMKHFCINRHNGGVNHLFMDWSVRKVGLKELWKLKWHRQFNTDGPWTLAGGATMRDWPEWMREFKDY